MSAARETLGAEGGRTSGIGSAPRPTWGSGAHVDATLLSWSNIGITVRIPRSDKLKPGNRYYLGISAQGDARWLSNIDQTVRLQARP